MPSWRELWPGYGPRTRNMYEFGHISALRLSPRPIFFFFLNFSVSFWGPHMPLPLGTWHLPHAAHQKQNQLIWIFIATLGALIRWFASIWVRNVPAAHPNDLCLGFFGFSGKMLSSWMLRYYLGSVFRPGIWRAGRYIGFMKHHKRYM